MTAQAHRPSFPTEYACPRNQWYVAAFHQDVGCTPLARTLLDTPVVLYRSEDGTPVALYDRCPHRGLPLSLGKIDGDRIRCGYHGIEYGVDGRAVHVPQQAQIYPTMCVCSYPLVEKGPFLWIWLGDPEKVDHGLLPDLKWMSLLRDDEHVVPYVTYEVGAHFQMVHDNLADTSHLPYLHEGMLEEGGMARTDIEFVEDGQSFSLIRRSPEIILPEQVAQLFGARPDTAYDRVFENATFVPSLCIGRQTLVECADPGSLPLEFMVINAVTPSTASRTFIFDVQVYPWAHGTDEQKQYVWAVLEQDRVAWEALQRRFDTFGDMREVSIISDTAGLKSRKIMERLVAQESAATVAA